MAVHAWPRNLHFLVSFFLLVSSPLTVRCLEQFYGTCGSTYDLMQTNTQSAILKVDMPSDMKMYQDPTRDIKCDIILTFTHGMNLLIDLYFVDIIPLSNDRKSCPTGLEIFDQTGRTYFGGRICMEAWEWEEKHQQAAYKPLVVESSPLTFRLVSDGPYKGQGFRVHLNQFRPYWPCFTREFRCEQVQRCVHDDLTCDGWDDCGDFSDERVNAGCHLLTPSEICGIIIGAILLIATGVVTVWFVITYTRLSKEFGLISESKMPIALNESKASIDPSLTFPRRYNSKESLSKISRSTAPTAANKYYSNNSLDKADLEKAESLLLGYRMTNDNMSERSYRSNPKKALNNTNQNDVIAEPIQKTGQYSARRGRNASQTSLNREKGNPPFENGQEKERRSQEKDGSDDDRRRRRSRDRSPRRDRYYSDDDSDYDYYRGRRHRRRSYDRYSDEDSDYERESRRRSRDRYRDRYDDDSDQDSDRAYRRRDSRERDRYRDDDRGRDSRDRDEDRDIPEKSRDRDDDRRRDSRERDRYRDEDRERRSPPDDKRRSPDDEYDDDRRRRHRRSRSGDRKRDSYDDDDRRRNRGRSPDRRRNYSPPPYQGQKENVGPGDEFPLPPPPSGEEIHRMELAKQLADQAKSAGQPSKAKLDSAQKPKEEIPKIPDLPKYEPQKSVTEVQKREQPRLESEPSRSSKAPSRQSHEPSKRQNDPPKQTYDPPKQTNEPPKQTYDPPKQTYNPPKQTYDPPKQTYDPPKQPSAPIQDPSEQLKAVSDPPKSRWEPPAKKREPQRQPPEPIDENVRKRNTTDRRERYSKNRWTPKENNRSQESPPPEYEDVSLPPTTNIKINYREESV
uniref:CUB domain-containing protein n=1 Tax=Biomphalaria glabrata TaxID=6526 RepID=A0A2C9KHG8_BIOGL